MNLRWRTVSYLYPTQWFVLETFLNWKAFKEGFDDFAIATQLMAKDELIQAATLKMIMGRECR